MISRATPKTILDPIDVVTGACYVDRTDFTLPGPIPLEWKTHYDSGAPSDGPLGWGWSDPYGIRLDLRKGGVKLVEGGGAEVPFPSVPEVGESVTTADGTLSIDRPDGETFRVHLPGWLIQWFRGKPDSGEMPLSSITERNGRSIEFHYRDGRLSRIVDSAGRDLSLSLDPDGRILSIACTRGDHPGGSVTPVRYAYDAAGNQVAATDAMGNTQFYEYDGDHRLLKRTDRNGYSFHYRYEQGLCVKTSGDDGLYSGEFVYDAQERKTVYRGFDGREIVYRYDKRGRVTEEIDPYGNVSKTIYDPSGNPAVLVDRCGRMTVHKYDDRGNRVETVDPVGRKKTWAYSAEGDLLEKVGPDGDRSAFSYDERGNLIAEISPEGVVSRHAYDEVGSKVSTHVTGQLPEIFESDAFGQLLSVRDPILKREIRAFRYDLFGNLVASWDGGGWTRYVFDPMGRLVEARYPDKTTEKNGYDPEGNVVSYTDRQGNTWHYRFRSWKQLVEITGPAGGVTRFDYTPADEMCMVIDPNGNRTEYLYDRNDRVRKVLRNGNVVETYERDPEGRLLAKRDPSGRILSALEYGAGDDPVFRKFGGGHAGETGNRYEYDMSGRLVSAENGSVFVKRSYDRRGGIANETIDGTGIAHEFDGKGRLVRTVFEDGVDFNVVYHGEATLVRDPNGMWNAWHIENGKIRKKHTAWDLQEEFEYDDRGRVTRNSVRKGEGSIGLLLDRRYEYDPQGRLVRWGEKEVQRYFHYDGHGRLAAVTSGESPVSAWETESYQHDPGGNLVSVKGASRAIFEGGNRISASGGRRYSHDDRGRRAVEYREGKAFRYAHDDLDQLASVSLPEGGEVRYAYDPLRRRILKETAAGKTRFGWEGERLSREIFPDGTKRYYFYPCPGEHSPAMFCERIPPREGDADPAGRMRIYSVHYDASSRPVLVTDDTGGIAWAAEYKAYGQARVHPDSRIVYNLRAPGQYFDAETTHHYNYHRYYDPETGRFLQPDPIGQAGGINVYAYGEGNPLAVVDVLGLADT